MNDKKLTALLDDIFEMRDEEIKFDKQIAKLTQKRIAVQNEILGVAQTRAKSERTRTEKIELLRTFTTKKK